VVQCSTVQRSAVQCTWTHPCWQASGPNGGPKHEVEGVGVGEGVLVVGRQDPELLDLLPELLGLQLVQRRQEVPQVLAAARASSEGRPPAPAPGGPLAGGPPCAHITELTRSGRATQVDNQ